MPTTFVEDVLRQNPHIDRKKLEEVSQLLGSIKGVARPQNTYGIVSRLQGTAKVPKPTLKTGR